jgi:hypothetical protein
MNRLAANLLGLAAFLAAGSAFGQTQFPTRSTGITAPGAVNMCLNSVGIAVPCDDLSGLPVRIAAQPDQNAPYPTGAIPDHRQRGRHHQRRGRHARGRARQADLYLRLFRLGDRRHGRGRADHRRRPDRLIAGLSGLIERGRRHGGERPVLALHPGRNPNTAITVTTTADGTATAVNVNSWGFQR